MKISWLVPFLIFLFLLDLNVEGKRKGLKIGKKVKRLFVHSGKKVKKVFVGHKHHHKKKKASAATTTTTTSLQTFINPTATTFTNSFTLSEILMTVTDRNYNYFFGYPTNIPGFKGELYESSRYLIAGRRKKCGCCDNKIIIVTKAPEERLI